MQFRFSTRNDLDIWRDRAEHPLVAVPSALELGGSVDPMEDRETARHSDSSPLSTPGLRHAV